MAKAKETETHFTAHNEVSVDPTIAAVEEKGLATYQSGALTFTLDGSEFEVQKLVTRPTLSHGRDADPTVYIKVLTEMRKEVRVDAHTGETVLGPPVMEVIDLKTGIECDYVASAVVAGRLEMNYPNNGYVGRMFVIEKYAGPSGKRYSRANISEITKK